VATAKLDAKSRNNHCRKVPGQALRKQCFLTVDPSRCLLLYPKQHWLEIEAKLLALPSLESRVRSLQRLLLGHAEEVEIDAQNRILISEPLRNFAGLERDVVFVGQGKKIELWHQRKIIGQAKGTDGNWSVKKEGSNRASSVHKNQESAWKEARRLARGEGSEAFLKGKMER